MKKISLTAVLLSIALSAPLAAAPTSIVGTVTLVGAYGNQAGTLLFALSSQPTTGCSNNNYFEVSPSTVTDPESRRNIYATLLTARATGIQVAVSFDTGAFCDTMGFPAIYSIFLQPGS